MGMVLKMDRINVMGMLENIAYLYNGKISSENIIKKIKKDPTIINYLNPDDLTEEIINFIIRFDNSNLFTDILVENSYMYNFLLIRYFAVCGRLPEGVSFTQDLVNELVVMQPNFVRLLCINEYYEYLSNFVLEIYLSCFSYAKLSDFPEYLLNERLILLALSKSNVAVSKLRKSSVTQLMREVESRYVSDNKRLYLDTLAKINIIKENINKQNILEVERRQMIGILPKLENYFCDADIGISSFCEKNGFSTQLFSKYMDILMSYNNDIKELFNELSDVHSKEGWNYAKDVIEILNNAIYNGVSSPEKDEIIPFNASLFFLLYNMDFDRVLTLLKKNKRSDLVNRLSTIIKPAFNNGLDIKFFYKNKFTYADGSFLSENEKLEIKEFMLRHGIPLYSTFASQVSNIYINGHIDLTKTYDKLLSYDFNEIKRNEIMVKANKINFQEVVIDCFDKKISDLKEERKKIIAKW